MSLTRSEQSRINGARSRGPKSGEGKVRSSRNATKHGVFSKSAVLECEDADGFHELTLRYLDRFRPVGEVELNIVEKIIAAVWRQQRLQDAATVLMDLSVSPWDGDAETGHSPDRVALARTFIGKGTIADALDRVARLESMLDRAYDRALRELAFVRKHYPSCQNEPESAVASGPVPVVLPFRREQEPSGTPDLRNEPGADPSELPPQEPVS
jgi:hypothetical protein